MFTHLWLQMRVQAECNAVAEQQRMANEQAMVATKGPNNWNAHIGKF